MTMSDTFYQYHTSETLSVLVRAAQCGNLSAFELLVQRFQNLAYHWAYTLIHHAQLAEDAVQEAFIEAYLNLPRLREPEAFPAWLRRIIFKQCDRLTRQKQFSTVSLEPNSSQDFALDDLNPLLIIEGQERQLLVHQSIASLSDHERSVIQLFYGSDLSLKEIAASLNVPLSTVKKRLFDARKHLKGKLNEVFPESAQVNPFARELSHQVRLLIAIRLHEYETVRSLLALRPFLVNGRTDTTTIQQYPIGYTALHEAASIGDTSLVTLLLEYGANGHARTTSGLQPLHYAILSSHMHVIHVLLEHGVHLNPPGVPPLHWAVMRGDHALVQLLLAYGADVTARAQSGRTALHWAALKGYTELVKLLLVHGASPHDRDTLGRTPRDWAMIRQQKAVVDLLDVA
jgi:RNA polymerase sigma factor (sigma-70 family)